MFMSCFTISFTVGETHQLKAIEYISFLYGYDPVLHLCMHIKKKYMYMLFVTS